jgi:DNA-binding response OmpR family regulator
MTLKALVVDDEPSILFTLSLVLKSRGFEVQTASSAKAAKERLAQTTFNLVVTDLSMETPTAGYEVIQAAKQLTKKPATLVISGFPDLLSKWETEGADAMVQKPTEVSELLAVIENLLIANTGSTNEPESG